MDFFEQYYQCVTGTLEQIKRTQREEMKAAALLMTETLLGGGLIHVFGCGHSHMVAEEMFYRAGGIADINPIFDSSIMLHEGAVKSSRMERMPGIAPLVLTGHTIRTKDTFLIASNSGINSYPIEMALAAKQRGCFVVCITSGAYSAAQSRHQSGKHIFDFCDVVIDNCVKKGDACVCISPEEEVYAGPVSSIGAFYIANTLMLQTCENLIAAGGKPKIFRSGNVPGTEEINQRYVDEFRGRVKYL